MHGCADAPIAYVLGVPLCECRIEMTETWISNVPPEARLCIQLYGLTRSTSPAPGSHTTGGAGGTSSTCGRTLGVTSSTAPSSTSLHPGGHALAGAGAPAVSTASATSLGGFSRGSAAVMRSKSLRAESERVADPVHLLDDASLDATQRPLLGPRTRLAITCITLFDDVRYFSLRLPIPYKYQGT